MSERTKHTDRFPIDHGRFDYWWNTHGQRIIEDGQFRGAFPIDRGLIAHCRRRLS